MKRRRLLACAPAMALATRPSAAEAAWRWCAPGAAPPTHEPPPAVELRGAERYGGDRAAEAFCWQVMRAAGLWRACRDADSAAWAAAALARWAAADALSRPLDVGVSRSNTNSVYSARRALTALAGAWLDLRDAPTSAAHAPVVERWLIRTAAVLDVNTGASASRASAAAVSNRNNHSYMRATIGAQISALIGDPAGAVEAGRAAANALATMNPDGSLPLEVARGGRALWYQRHALASLAYLGELTAAFGVDVWKARDDGRSLHDAVAFLARAVDDPRLVRRYAVENRDPAPGVDPAVQDLGFLERRPNGRHYMAWIELYTARHPGMPAGLRLAARAGVEGARPLVDDYVGGDATARALGSGR